MTPITKINRLLHFNLDVHIVATIKINLWETTGTLQSESLVTNISVC